MGFIRLSEVLNRVLIRPCAAVEAKLKLNLHYQEHVGSVSRTWYMTAASEILEGIFYP